MNRHALVLVMLVGTAACVSNPPKNNLTPANLEIEPSVSTYKDPSVDFAAMKTFSVFPMSALGTKVSMNPIMEKQMLFFLRNQLEGKNYRFVELNEEPDFVATIVVDSEYKETYVPPQAVTIPQWVPGKTITSFGNSSGTFNYNTYGAYSSYGWGSYSGTSSSTTYVPGYLTARTYTKPGHNVGYHYPTAIVAAYDAKTLENIWLGSGAGTSVNPDPRVSSQVVLTRMLSQFPPASRGRTMIVHDGVVGIGLGIFTVDGNNYFPTVMDTLSGSPAKKAGLRVNDMILTVDGVPVANMPLSEVKGRVSGIPGSDVRLAVWRNGKQLEFSMQRASRADVFK